MSDASGAQAAEQQLLEDRYGRGRKRKLDMRLGWIVAGALVLGGILFVLFGGWQETSNLEYKDLDYSVVDERTVSVYVQLTKPADAHAICAIEALSSSYATVGWKLVEVPPAQERTGRFTVELVTTSPAATGTVRECWLSEF